MDFGINGKRAIVCAGSKGLRKACAMALAGECVNITTVGRGKEALEAVTREIRNPGARATDSWKSRMAAMAVPSGKAIDDVARQRLSSIPAGRFGDPLEFGQLCTYICSARASNMTGQNFLIDGGSYPGTL